VKALAEFGAPRPLRLEPIFVERIWGEHTLEPFFRLQNPGAPIGEVWLTGNDCRFTDDRWPDRSLAELWRAMPADWAGSGSDRSSPFPLLVKFLFPAQKLSVQVHPSDEHARQQERAAALGKTEMWYALAARDGAEVFVGLRPGVTAEVFRRRVEDGTVEGCLNRIALCAGEAVFVPAGTAHTIGPGSVLCEIQQHSDLTYRVFDYGRRTAEGSARPLHLDKAMAVINFGAQRGGKITPACVVVQGGEIAHLVACRYFAVERWSFASPLELGSEPEHFELWIACAGRGRLRWNSAESDAQGGESYAAGQAFFIPAVLPRWRIEPQTPTTMLRAWVPDLRRYAEQLAARGLCAEKIAGIVQQ
jgi:mannose-6-phosphate isomerase